MKLILLVSIVAISGCNHYYQAIPLPMLDETATALTIDSLTHQNRYFILRNGNRNYCMNNPAIGNDKKTIVSLLENTTLDHRLHFMKGVDGKQRYNNRTHGRQVLNEVHFYIPSDTKITMGPNRLNITRLEKIEIIKKDKARTSRSRVIGVAAGIALGAYILVTLRNTYF